MSAALAQLSVRVYDVHVGTLDRNASGLVTFTPAPSWVEGGQRPRLGLAFLRDSSARKAGTGLPPWFENLLPESESLLRQRICAQLQLRESDSFGLLKALGHDLVGAVKVSNGGDDEDELALVADDSSHTEIERDSSWRFSLAGVQLKFSMTMRGKKFAMPARNELGRWIVKIPPSNMSQLPRIEHSTMRWAAASGLPVAETRIVSMNEVQIPGFHDLEPDAEVLAVRRFDRTEDGGRIHQEDLAQALDIGPEGKYAESDNVRIGHDWIAEFVADAAGKDVAKDYVRRLAFAIASGNTDEHLKNWSLQWWCDDLSPVLSPCYDQVSIISLQNYGWHEGRQTRGRPYPRLALPLGGTRDLVSLDDQRLEVFSQRSRLEGAASILREGLETARDAWRTIAPEAPEDMAAALSEHWKRVPLLRSVGPLDS